MFNTIDDIIDDIHKKIKESIEKIERNCIEIESDFQKIMIFLNN